MKKSCGIFQIMLGLFAQLDCNTYRLLRANLPFLFLSTQQ